jgi:serine/threonine protein kinase
VSDRDNPARTLDSQNAQTKIDAGASTSVDAEATLDSALPAEPTPRRDLTSIGPYRLVKKLGEGGMGQVWLAEQTAPLERQVALKLIKVGMYDDSVLQRFQTERQSLAIMEHPWIAKVFDAGATADGQPYFVMEYVPGVPITDYCDRKRMKIRERLDLFIKVCEGVQHAHQKAIMHRDLKPANILVVEVDGEPVPRIIDFGLAKAATPLLDGQLFIQVGGWVGTPGYMSPEQADPTVADVDTRTDVYSLGAVLYVLLTGFLPFETKDWRKQRFDEFLRRLREEDPPRPSTKIGIEKESSKATAEVRGSDPKQLVSLLHGDLDWLIMRALEKDRARRYGTPSELAADIRRYLHNEPIVARPASTSYRLQKYLRRHRIGVAAAAGVVAVLIAFAVTQAVQLRRITRERDRANRITEFMTSMFNVSDPSEARGNSITAREILEKASKEIDQGLEKDPEVQAQMMDVMGNVYVELGLYPRAESLRRRTVDIRRRTLGPLNPDTLKSMNDLAWTLFEQQAHLDEAEKLQREALDIARHTLGPNDVKTLKVMRDLAGTLLIEGRYAESEKLMRNALGAQRHILGPYHRDTMMSINNLGSVLREEGRYAEAEKLQREALDIHDRVFGRNNPRTLTTMNNLAWTLEWQGQYAEAEKLYREALDIERRVLGSEHSNTLFTIRRLGSVLREEGYYGEAERLQREGVDIDRRVFGLEYPETLASTDALALTLAHEGHYAEAEKLERETRDTQRRVLGAEHPDTLTRLTTWLVSQHASMTTTRRSRICEKQSITDSCLRRILIWRRSPISIRFTATRASMPLLPTPKSAPQQSQRSKQCRDGSSVTNPILEENEWQSVEPTWAPGVPPASLPTRFCLEPLKEFQRVLLLHKNSCQVPNIRQRIISGISTNISSLIGTLTVFSHRSIRISYPNTRNRTAADTAKCSCRAGERAAA